jgi:mannose-6-phosphate isomerase-like protein (cupin superfamily)
MEKVNINQKFELFSEHWTPKIIGELNDSHIKIAKLEGEFVWHRHENEDEMFLVVKGSLLLKFRDREVRLEAGEFLVVPRGVEHLPIAEEEEVHLLMIEPKTTLNTGDIKNERTVERPQYL